MMGIWHLLNVNWFWWEDVITTFVMNTVALIFCTAKTHFCGTKAFEFSQYSTSLPVPSLGNLKKWILFMNTEKIFSTNFCFLSSVMYYTLDKLYKPISSWNSVKKYSWRHVAKYSSGSLNTSILHIMAN